MQSSSRPAVTTASRAAPRVLVVTAAMGSGHTRVAAELARRLTGLGARAGVVDVVQAAGAPGRLLQHTYRRLLADAPWLYGASMRTWQRFPGPFGALVASGSGALERALAAAVDRSRPDVVVSTYNLAAQALGRLVGQGRLRAPLVTLVTDPGAHPYWVSPHAALHVAPLPATARRLEQYGGRPAVTAPPVLRPEVAAAPTGPTARQRLGLPLQQRVVLVSAGSWAAGRVERTVRAVRGIPGALVVVLCGRDGRLRARLAGVSGVRAVGWTDDMPAYLAAADVLVDNAGGLTCWEAFAVGTPVVLYEPLPGHGRLNAAALAGSGLVAWARTPAALREAVRAPLLPPTRVPVTGPGAEHLVLAAAGVDTRAPA